MNHTRIELVVAPSREADMDAWYNKHSHDLDYWNRQGNGEYAIGYRVRPEGLMELIGEMLADQEAVVVLRDDVGNSPTWYFGDDIYFSAPAILDEDQGTMRMDRDSFDRFEAQWIERMRDGERHYAR